MRRRGVSVVLAALLVAGAPLSVASGREEPSPAERARAHARDLSAAFKEAARAIEPSVVHITTVAERTVQRRDVFGRSLGPQRFSRQGLGSGVILSEDGLIVTNHHVVDGATRLVVRLNDGSEHPAEVLGSDPLRDLALLRVRATGLKAASFGVSERLEPGEWVLAVGSPFGFSSSFTAGIVSATGRGLGIRNNEFRDFEDFIQTDAAINPGNSGGPLIDLDGRVVGINTAIFSRSGGNVGLGFAIPAHVVQPVLAQLETRGRVDAGYLGVRFQSVPEGLRIVDVIEAGPAARAGLRTGDVVIGFNDRRLSDDTALLRAIQFAPPGTRAGVRVLRNGAELVVPVDVGSRADMLRAMLHPVELQELGVEGVSLDREASEITGLRGPGVLLLSVRPGSAADRAGLVPYDVVLGLARIRTETPRELEDLLRRVPEGQGVRVDLIRDGREAVAELVR